MPDLDDLNDDISQSATDPKSMTVADVSATQQSIDDKIKAADRLAGQQAVNRTDMGIRRFQVKRYYP